MLFVAKWMQLENIICEVNQRQIPYDITYMYNVKKMIQMNLFTKQKQTHRLRKQIYRYQKGKVRRNKLGVWDQHIHTITYKIENKHKEILYRELYIQYSVIMYIGKNLKKNRYMYN